MITIQYPNRLPLAMLPTPLERIQCSLHPPDGALWMKRDDLTGAAATGNKIRKLEFLLAEARMQGSDCILTCGGTHSNHARSCAVASASLGMKSYLFLRGNSESISEGNLLLDRILGAHIEFLSADDYICRRDEIMQSYAYQLAQKGHHPYIIPEGGSNALGSFGYIQATEEIYRQVQMLHIPIDGIVCAVGSGGTYSGLWLGTHLLQWDIPVWGINICETAAYFQNRICEEIQATIHRFSFPLSATPGDIHIIDGYVYAGYSEAPPHIHECIHGLASETGLILEPVYTAKAFHGMLQEWRLGTFGPKPHLIFIHTGGIFGLLTHKYAPFYS